MSWLQLIDVAVFRFINGTLANSFFDGVMPVFAGNAWFWPVMIICGLAAVWKGGARGRLCVLMLAIVLPLGDGWITNSIKHAVGRPRPCLTLENVNLPMSKSRAVDSFSEYRKGCSPSGSFPSGHTTNWFAATMVAWMFYRRTLRFMLPLACIVGFSRIYNGVHYPSDVLGGVIVGAGYAVALAWAVDAIWRFVGHRWFPLWWERLPTLIPSPKQRSAEVPAAEILGSQSVSSHADAPTNPTLLRTERPHSDTHWLRLGYVVIAAVFIGRLLYLGSGLIELSEDEAYQWLWSKHPALSYYSKPPLIAYTQWLGTHLWGDTEFGVRFFSPLLAAIGSIVTLRFFARHVNARAGFWLVALVNVTPLFAVGSTLLTVDPLLVFFWTLAMISGWHAAGPNGGMKGWFWTGLWMGLAFLSKYTALFQWLSWAVFFVLHKPARLHLRKPGPYLALVVNALCALPVVIWNAQHGWITASHVASDAKLHDTWSFNPLNMGEFLGGTAALMNPILFLAATWACVAIWARNPKSERNPKGIRNPKPTTTTRNSGFGLASEFGFRHSDLQRYFFSMGAPLFMAYLLYTIHSNVLVNWIAAAVIPLFCVMVIFWDAREREHAITSRRVRAALAAAMALGIGAVAFLHESTPFLNGANKVAQQIGAPMLPEALNPLRRVRGWKEMARLVEQQRLKFEAEGKPVFVIGGHYGTTSLLSFYTPAARTNLTTRPLVYYRYLPQAKTQFHFWPTYLKARRGENALYVQEKQKPTAAPPDIAMEFESVKPVGWFPVFHRGRILHYVQIFACRGLK